MTIDEKLPQRVHQMRKATESMLTVFFNLKEFARVNLLSQGASLTAPYFTDITISPLASWQAQQSGDITSRKVYLHFDNPQYHIARDVEEEITSDQ
jgi:hypothetical protein